MDKLVQIGEDAKNLLYDMRAEQAIDLLFSASEYISDLNSLAEKELVDWYAFYAVSIKEVRLPIEIKLSEREYLDASAEQLEKIQQELDDILQRLISWFSEIEDVRNPTSLNRPFRNPRSKSPQNRLCELKARLEKQLHQGLSEDEWESTLTLIEEQLRYVVGWQVWRESGSWLWSTVKPGSYAKYAKLLLKQKDIGSLLKNIRTLIAESINIESKQEKIKSKFFSYSNKSSSIGIEIDRAISNFRTIHHVLGGVESQTSA